MWGGGGLVFMQHHIFSHNTYLSPWQTQSKLKAQQTIYIYTNIHVTGSWPGASRCSSPARGWSTATRRRWSTSPGSSHGTAGTSSAQRCCPQRCAPVGDVLQEQEMVGVWLRRETPPLPAARRGSLWRPSGSEGPVLYLLQGLYGG